MDEHWSPSEVTAWTDHDGPRRPPAGPDTKWYRGLAIAFGGWFALAIIGCEAIHHSGAEHVPVSVPETLGAVAVFLGLPAMIVLLSRREAAGAWMAAALGGLAAAVSLTQWELSPWYTAVEAGGFALCALAGLGLAVAQLASRPAPERDTAVDLTGVDARPGVPVAATSEQPAAR